MKAKKVVRGISNALFKTVSGRSCLMVAGGLLFWILAPSVFAQAPGTPDPIGDIGTVATDSLTLIFQVIGVILVLVGLGLFINSAVNIMRGRATGGDLMLSFVVAGALLLIGIAFVAYGVTQVGNIGSG